MSRLSVILAAAAGMCAPACDGVADASVVVEVRSVPPGTTELAALVIAADREMERAFDDAEALSSATVTFAVAVDREQYLRPLTVTVTATAGACAVARGSASCALDEPCEEVSVELEEIAPECGDGADAGAPPVDANNGRFDR